MVICHFWITKNWLEVSKNGAGRGFLARLGTWVQDPRKYILMWLDDQLTGKPSTQSRAVFDTCHTQKGSAMIKIN
jgi:hypothetical protein